MASADRITEKEVKSTISSLLTSTPRVSTIQTIQKDYKEVVGRDIPYYLFKCNSVEHFLKSIPDICIVSGSGPYAPVHPVINEKNAHIHALVTKQKLNVKNRHNTFNIQRRRAPVNYFGGPKLNAAKHTIAPSSFSHVGSNNTPPKKLPPTNQVDKDPIKMSPPKNQVLEKTKHANIELQKVTPNIFTETNKIAGLTQYRTKIGKSVSSNSFDIPHNAPIGRSWSEEKVSRANNDYVAKMNNLSLEPVRDTEDEDMSNVPNRVQANLKSLISEFPDGIWSADLPKYYQKKFKKDLSFIDYGYTSLIEMCISLKHIFHYVRPGKDDFKLYDRSKPLPLGADKVYTIASYDTGEKLSYDQALPELEWSDFQGHIPEDAFAHGNDIPNQFLPEGSKTEDVLDVVVVEIYDPSKFWFYLGTSESPTVLDELMDEIQTFYNNPQNAQEYAIPPGAVKEGLYCVQIIYGEYHRAKIVRVLPDNNECVRVLYIDYGTVCKAPIKGMCFLRSNFAKIPAQAMRGRLANICPQLKGHPWPRSASDRFRELVNRRDTQIKISYIDREEDFVCVFLADVTDWKNVLYVNETLVKEHHAVWDGEKQISPLLIPNYISKVQNMHLFPTFLELEYGLAPNASEMYSLAAMLVPLQFCIPQYFERVEQVSVDEEIRVEAFEKCFISTVKHHRKYTQWNTVDCESILKSRPMDFDIFGDLKDEIKEFCEEMGLIEDIEHERQEDEASYDNQDVLEGRNVEENDPIQLLNLDKELSENIIKKLETYSILDSDLLSLDTTISDGPEDLLTCLLPHECFELDLCKESLAPQKCADNTTTEKQSENNMNLSIDSSSGKTCSTFCPNQKAVKDVNIFDNPEAFENCSDSSRESDSPVTPESFLRNIECKIFDSTYVDDACDNSKAKRLTNKNLEEFQISINVPLKSNIEATKNSFVQSLSSTNPFREFLVNNNFTSSNSFASDTELSRERQFRPKKAKEQTSDSDESDYKSYVPSETSLPFTPLPESVERYPGYPTVYSPSYMRPPPYMGPPPPPQPRSMNLNAYAPAYVPSGYFPYQYPQWSNADYLVPNWNNMVNYPAPHPPYPGVRPPPGFTAPPLHQPHRPFCPPVPAPYAYGGRPMCYNVPRPMAPQPPVKDPPNLITPKDFYDRYNEQLLKSMNSGQY